MDKIVIDGMGAPFDGEYPFDWDLAPLTTREWGWIKDRAGYLPANLMEGLAGGDARLACTFALIALHRSGKVAKLQLNSAFEQLEDAPYSGQIALVMGEKEDDLADPPSAPPTGSASSAIDGASTSDSGNGSSAILAPSEAIPDITGEPV